MSHWRKSLADLDAQIADTRQKLSRLLATRESMAGVIADVEGRNRGGIGRPKGRRTRKGRAPLLKLTRGAAIAPGSLPGRILEVLGEAKGEPVKFGDLVGAGESTCLGRKADARAAAESEAHHARGLGPWRALVAADG